ncbi:MAG: DUF983 domain-containing protein [Actinomycetota bacterium]
MSTNGHATPPNGDRREPSLGDVLSTPQAERSHAAAAASTARDFRPGIIAVVRRGLLWRCPRCGGRDLFVSWFAIREACPTCALSLQREEGGFLGAMTVNYLFTAFVFVLVLVTWLLIDLPDVNVAALTATSAAIVVVVPLLFFRSAKVIWAGVEFLVWRSQPEPTPRRR